MTGTNLNLHFKTFVTFTAGYSLLFICSVLFILVLNSYFLQNLNSNPRHFRSNVSCGGLLYVYPTNNTFRIQITKY